MRYLFICLLFVAVQSTAQNLTLDSFGFQNGYRIYHPHALTIGPKSFFKSKAGNLLFYASTTGVVNTNGDTESYAIMRHDLYTRTTSIIDSGSHPLAFPSKYRHSKQIPWGGAFVADTGGYNYNRLNAQNELEYCIYNAQNNIIRNISGSNGTVRFDVTNGLRLLVRMQKLDYQNGTWYIKSYSFSNKTIDSIALPGYSNVWQRIKSGSYAYIIGINAMGNPDLIVYNSYTNSISIYPLYINGNRITKVHEMTDALSKSYMLASDGQRSTLLNQPNSGLHDSVFVPLKQTTTGLAIDSVVALTESGALIYFNSPKDTATGSFDLYAYIPYQNQVKKIHTFFYDKYAPIAADPYCREFVNYQGQIFMSAPNGKDRVLWRLRDFPHKTHSMSIVTLPGIPAIINPSNFVTAWDDSSYNTHALYFIGSNDGHTKIYRFTDSAYHSGASVAAVHSNFTITLYPNPTTKDAYLDVKLKEAQTMQVQMADIQGRVVYSTKAQLYSAGSHSITLPVQQLPHGTYIYRIADENGILLQSGKLLKQ